MIPIFKIPFVKLYTIEDLNIRAFSQKQNDKHQVKILVVDDHLFEYKAEMLEAGFNICDEQDITNLDSAAAYHVIICDYRGVGKKYQYEGIGLVNALKNKYPYKLYAIYSAGNEVDMETIKLLSDVKIVPKNLDKDDWKALLQKYVEESMNPKTIWYKMRALMLNAGISTYNIAVFEHKYVDTIMNKRGDFSHFLEEDNINIPQDLKSLLISITANAISKAIGL